MSHKAGVDMKYAGKSHKGMVREKNEDSHNIIDICGGIPVVFIIADGMGGHNSGGLASRLAVKNASEYIKKAPEMIISNSNIPSAITDIIQATNSSVYESSRQNIENSGMGTTFIIAVAFENKLFIGHVGDSRVYLLRNDDIIKITTDHSYIEELVKIGSLTREEAENHPKKNIITRALGCFDTLEADIFSCDIKKGDSFILCTDGLTNMLSEQEIKGAVLDSKTPEKACDLLINMANQKGGKDNITVIVISNG
jgi:PPM family protein phosphatase